MRLSYSTYEAKAKFSDILRKVRAGQRIVISFRGKPVAEIRPIEEPADVEQSLRDLEANGIVESWSRPAENLGTIARKPGALARFLESRD